MELIERIGAFLGLAAFLGLGALALLYFQQGREVRRLRDWAGQAPERASAAAAEAEAALSAESEEVEAEPAGPTLAQRMRERWDGWMARLPGGIGERLPGPLWLALIALAAIVIGAGVATGGFGLTGDDEPAKQKAERAAPPEKVEVAVLNGTAVTEGAPGVPGLAAVVADEVKGLGYKLGPVTDSGTPFDDSVVMYDTDQEAEAEQLATDIKKLLGKTGVEKRSGAVADQSGDATVTIVIGQDDSQLE